MRSAFFALPLSCLAGTALAEVPKIVTDIAPVQSLVAQVMGDLGTPYVLVEPGASPHGYALRPSQARQLNQADLVFWIGEALTPWLEGPLDSLAKDARVTELLEVDGTTLLRFRETAVFAAEDHDDHTEGHNDHADEHDDHDTHDEDHDHDHDGLDPHAWLDPDNAQVWLRTIAVELSAQDPQNAETYQANAAAASATLSAVTADIAAQITPVNQRSYVVYHDAYQYFDTRFGLRPIGAISQGDASAPSPARIKELRGEIQAQGIDCAFTEPQFDQRLITTVFEGTSAKTAVLDPLGTEQPQGAALYEALLRNLAQKVVDCLE